MKFIHIFLMLIISISVNAGIFYISPSGNNTNAGTQNSPWKTLAYACQNTIAGDVIHVVQGAYTETSTSNLKAGVSIEGEGYNITLIKANIGGGNTFLSLSSGQNTNGNQTILGIFIDGGYLSESSKGSGYAIKVSGRSNVVIKDCKIVNFFENAIIFDGFDATSPHSDPGVTAIGNKILNTEITNCSTIHNQEVIGTFGNGCVMIGGQTGLVIDNCKIGTTTRPNFKNGWAIKYWDNGWLKGCKITNCTLTKPPYQATYWGQNGDWDFVIELFNIQGLEIGNNIIQGAIDLNYNYKGNYPYSVWIHDNKLNHATPNYTHPESGIIFEFKTESAIVENNTFNNCFVGISYNLRYPTNHGDYTYNCGTGGCSAVTDNIIRNNLFTNLYSAPYGASGGVITQMENGTEDPYITNMLIENNTFVAKSTQGAPTGIDFTSQSRGTVTGVTISKNIFQGFNGGSVTGNKAQTQSNISITQNAVWQTSLPTWTSATLSGNISANPNFDANYKSTLGIGYNGSGNPPPTNCTYTYGAWSVCDPVTNTQSRSVAITPQGCVQNPPPILTQSCTVTPPDLPPVVTVSPNQTIKESFVLSCTATSQVGIATYKWTKLSGNSVTLVTPTAPDTEVLYTSKGIRQFQIEVTDNSGLKTRKTVTVTIQ